MKTIKLTYLIDDDSIVSLIVKKIANKHPLFDSVEHFISASLCLERLLSLENQSKELPNLMLLDLNMTGMDGWEFLDEIEKSPILIQIPIVVFTSSLINVDLDALKKRKGVIDCISKPITFEKMDIIYQQLLDKS